MDAFDELPIQHRTRVPEAVFVKFLLQLPLDFGVGGVLLEELVRVVVSNETTRSKCT